MAKYDEDLHENQFFITLTEKYSNLFTKAVESCWVICVPRAEAVLRMKLNQSEFENHILMPYMASPGHPTNDGSSYFVSVNGKYLDINGEYIRTGDGYKDEKQIKILFDESFFNSKDENYQILCIDQPMEGGSDERTFTSLETFEDCKNFLWNDSIAREKFKKVVDSQLTTFSSQLKIDFTPDQIKDSAYAIYQKILHVVERLPHIKRIQTSSGKQFFLLATETYVLNSLHPSLFRILCRNNLGDSQINKVTRKTSDIKPIDLGIKQEYSVNISKARKCLSSLNKCYSPFEKVQCFKETISILTKLSHSSNTSTVRALTADELLPMLVYLVLTSEIPNWRSNLYYISELHFSEVSSEEILYYMTSFEAAAEYITSGSLEKNLSSHMKRARLPSNGDPTDIERLDKFFKSVCEGNVKELEDILSKLPSEISETLCHPLCDCTKCTPIIQKYHDNPNHVGVHSHDLLYRTALHYAAITGHEIIFQKLLLENKELRCDIDAADSSQQTPLHLACLHGNQKCLLYLLSEGANINKVDKQGNTPLHLACSYGHEECVKALMFHKKSCNVNAPNESGDTPLHLAARWNYVSIVSFLLSHGADKNYQNLYDDTPQSSTYNTKIYLMLRSPIASPTVSMATTSEDIDGKSEVKLRSPSIAVGGASKPTNQKNRRQSGLATNETERQMKKLFRYINDNDVSMVKYMFGWRDGDRNDTELCHPLCQCADCKLKKVQVLHLTVNTCDSRGTTPLHKAALHGSRAIVQCLLEHGATRNARTKDELVTPLHLACQYNHKDVVMILLENSVDLNPKDVKGNTPLHFCCNNGHMDSAALLMIHGADVTTSNDRGDTPLHNAARWNHASLVKELILYGAQYSCTNNEDKTPSDLTSDDEVLIVLGKAMRGEITTGEYAPLSSQYACSPGISDDEDFEHV